MRKIFLMMFVVIIACMNISCLQPGNNNNSTDVRGDSVTAGTPSMTETRDDNETNAVSIGDSKENISSKEADAINEDANSKGVARSSQSRNLELFTHLDRFGKKTRQHMEDRGFKQYHLMTTNVIDPDGDEQFNEDAVERYLNNYFPSKDARGLCVIDWEKKKYMDLKKDVKSNDFKLAEQHFIELIKFVKSKRPNVQVGFYGVPFRVFTNRYPDYGRKDKFTKLLSECDVITPSLYSKFTDEEIGKEKNTLYLENNIKNGIEYSNLLKKPLYFFVWEVVQDNQKDRRLMPIEEFRRQIETVEKKQVSNNLIKGVIYWTPYNPETFYRNITMPTTNLETKSAKTSNFVNSKSTVDVREIRDGIVTDYFNKAF